MNDGKQEGIETFLFCGKRSALHMIEFESLARLSPSAAANSRSIASHPDTGTDAAANCPPYYVLGDALVEPFNKITRLAARLLDTPAAVISLAHGDIRWPQFRFGIEIDAESIREAELDVSTFSSLLSCEPQIRNLSEPLVVAERAIRFYAAMPLVSESGCRFGSLCVLGTEHRELNESEITTLADLAAIAVDEIELRLSGLSGSDQKRGALWGGSEKLASQKETGAKNVMPRTELPPLRQENEERYQSLVGLLSDWHWEQDEHGRFTLIAEAGQTRTGARFRPCIGKTFREIPAIQLPEREWRNFDQTIARHQPFQEIVLQWKESDEPLRYLSVSGQPMFSADGVFKGYRGVSREVTEKIRFQQELARSNAALRELSEAQQAFREAERKRIAHELHDELAQILATSRMELSLLQRDLKPASATHARFDNVDRMIGSSIVSLRKLATDLRPSALDEGGLYYALRSLLKAQSESTKIEFQLIANEADLAMDESRSTAIFRLVEECLTNIDKHAQAKKAVIQIHRSGNSMEIRVQDDGKGIRQDEIHKRKAFGLMDMRERVRKMKGKIDIKGCPGKGTRIAVSLPQFFPA
jgi:PAS domain S-box-containing protein